MLRITTKEQESCVVFAMEGRLCGAWTAEARQAWLRTKQSANGHSIVLDLAGVTFVDRLGEELLAEILASGVSVHSNGVLVSHIVERVRNSARSAEPPNSPSDESCPS